MKKTILIGLTLGLVFGLSGCTEKDKKAKDIAAEKIIVDHEKDQEVLKSMKKDHTTRDFSSVLNDEPIKNK